MRKFLLLIFLLLLTVSGWGIYKYLFALPVLISTQNSSSTPTPPSALSSVVSAALSGTTGTYGVVIKHLSTGESYSLNPHQSFSTGSLYKLWVMAAIYQRLQSGSLPENTTLSKNVADLNAEFSIASDEAELTTGTVTMSLDDALYQTIALSGNYSAFLLTDYIKSSGINSFLQDYGFSESKVGTNTSQPVTTAADTAKFFESLYTGRLANSQYTQSMLNLLKKQQLNEKLPKNLPDGVVIAHKTGELDNYTHDAGIVFTPHGNYIIVVLTQSDAPSLAQGRIADISQAVYKYFTQ